MILANFHSHTTFCDGKNTPEEMVERALELGMFALGFSGHAYIAYDGTTGMDEATTAAYRQEVLRLKEKYKNKIDIFLGIELDGYSPAPDYPYDYRIGSVHGIMVDGEYMAVDYREDFSEEVVKNHFGGDYYAYIEEYYRAETLLAPKYDPDIIGHFDLVTKFNENNKHFDESHPRYRKAALESLETLMKLGKPFEINTGAISRGYRQTPYPAPFLLKAIHDMGGSIILSSDCHSRDGLLCNFEEATDMAKRCGFTTALVLTADGFKEADL